MQIERSGAPVKSFAMLATGLAVGIVACPPEPIATEPSTTASSAASAAATYTAIDLGTLGGRPH